MVAKTSIYYDIVTEYQNKGEKQAETGLTKLSKSALSLAKTYGVAFSGAALIGFGVKAVKAAADENKAFTILGNTLKNLGLGFASVDSKAFIENLSLSTGIAIDQLIPAYQNLLTATGDVALSQKSLQTAMDVSVGTGKDLVTVTQAMAKGYLGNTTGLMRLGAGLDKALVKTGRMDLIMKQLSNTFKGGATAAANTAAGAMARLGEATHLATVSIGEGLIYAFDSLSSGSSVQGATSSIVDFGNAISNAIKGVGDLITKIKSLVYLGPILGPLLKGLAFIIDKTNPEILITRGLGQIHASTLAKIAPTDRQVEHQLQLEAAAQKKVLDNKAAQKKLEADILASQKKQTLEQKNQAMLKILGSVSQDFERANILAALAHAQTQEIKDQLQYQLDLLDATNQTGAAQTKTIDNAIILKEKMLLAMGQVMLVDGSIVNLADAKNPFAGFDKYVQDALNAILKLNQAILNMPSVMPGGYGTYGGSGILPGYGTTYGPGIGATGDTTTSSGSSAPLGRYGVDYGPGIGATTGQTVSLNISLDPGLIINTTNASTANGSPVSINRLSNQFASV
jgi:hypothetical protein